MIIVLCLMLSLCIIPLSTQAPIVVDHGTIEYLEKFGYLDQKDEHNEESEHEAIRDFQHFSHLNETGQLDSETISLMETPRCGVKDVLESSHHHSNHTRRKRFTFFGGKWKKKELTYRITKYSRHLSRDVVDEEIAKSFEVWERVTPLTITPAEPGTKADILIRFVTGFHGDGFFDGRGGTLAHAASPAGGGDVCLDDAEPWSNKFSKSLTNLWDVATHELGHSLGLGHSNVRKSVMAPFYSQGRPVLQSDDIRAIQKLYGKRNQQQRNKG